MNTIGSISTTKKYSTCCVEHVLPLTHSTACRSETSVCTIHSPIALKSMNIMLQAALRREAPRGVAECHRPVRPPRRRRGVSRSAARLPVQHLSGAYGPCVCIPAAYRDDQFPSGHNLPLFVSWLETRERPDKNAQALQSVIARVFSQKHLVASAVRLIAAGEAQLLRETPSATLTSTLLQPCT
jgi:hypothetical protein